MPSLKNPAEEVVAEEAMVGVVAGAAVGIDYHHCDIRSSPQVDRRNLRLLCHGLMIGWLGANTLRPWPCNHRGGFTMLAPDRTPGWSRR